MNMTIDDKLKATPIRTGFECIMAINTRGRRTPLYLYDYLIDIGRTTNGLFRLVTMSEITNQLEHWKDESGIVNDGDNLLEIIFTLDLELTSEQFEDYCRAMILENIIPFLDGCKFLGMGVFFQYQLFNDYIDLQATSGLDITIMQGSSNVSLMQIIAYDMFGLRGDAWDDFMRMMDLIGNAKVENCINDSNIVIVEEALNYLGVKYKIS